jgi:hypothetical protein
MMKRISLILIFMILSLSLAACSKDKGQIGPDAPPDSIPELIGTYVVNGTDYHGNDYGGHLTIMAGDNPSVYKFQWILVESIQEGIGMVDGNKILIEWRSLDTSTEPYQGAVTYTITVNGELYGTRTVEGQEGVSNEIAYPNR